MAEPSAAQIAKAKAAAAERDAYLRFLDRRLPELHAEGKKHVHSEGTLAEQVVHTRENMETATYPGVVALIRAKQEWGARGTSGVDSDAETP